MGMALSCDQVAPPWSPFCLSYILGSNVRVVPDGFLPVTLGPLPVGGFLEVGRVYSSFFL